MRLTAILIPIYNGLEYTRKCIEMLAQFTSRSKSGTKYIIIVIDDGSRDGSYEYIKTHYPYVELLKGDGNLWWSGGINVGARYAIENLKCDYVLLWNNDVYPADNYFTELDKIIEKTEGKVIIGSKVYFSHKPDTIQAYGGYFNPRTGVKYTYAYNSEEKEEFNQVKICDWLPGMGTLIPSDAVIELDYWDDKNFPQYHGDSDFTFRAKKAGYTIKVVPQLKIWNNTENTGINYPTSLKLLWQSLRSIRSDYNLKKDVIFYRFHASSIFSAWGLSVKYFWLIYFMIKYLFFKYILKKRIS